MLEADRVARNRARLQECFPWFRTALALVLAELQADGFRPRIQCAWRSVADQEEAFRTGHSHVRFGFHNVTGAGGVPEALAADVLDDDHPLDISRAYVLALARAALKHGLTTGIDWDLPTNIRVVLNAAIASGADYVGKLGFDPMHIECTGITIPAARSGRRPPLVKSPALNA